MRVKVGNTWYDCEVEPVAVELTAYDKQAIANMPSDATRYGAMPDDAFPTRVAAWRWLAAEPAPTEPSESDSPVWFGRDVEPEVGRLVVWEIPDDEFRADRWGEGDGWSSACLRWRYAD